MNPSPARRPWLAGGAAAGGLAGATVAALAGLCCAGPVTVVLLGAGGAVAAAGLKPYRVPLLLISAALLAVGYWRTYRGAATGTSACPVRVGRWVRASLVAAAMVWVAAAALAAVQ
jgi:hypothetical protein